MSQQISDRPLLGLRCFCFLFQHCQKNTHQIISSSSSTNHMRHLARILICVITLTLFLFIENSHQAITNEIPIWPKPFQTDISGSLTPVIVNHKTFKFDQGNVPTSGDVQQMLLAAIESYRTIMFYDDELPARTSSPLCQQTQKYLCLDSVKFVFNVTSAVDTELTLDMDERYALSVSSSSSVVVI